MPKFLHPLLFMVASVTHSALIRQIQYLKVENEILRSKLPKRITVTPPERRRLIKYGRSLGSTIRQLISIVSPRTFARWMQAEAVGGIKRMKAKKKPGRPRTPEEIREVILRLARENGWGYTRILGELRKLGITKVSKTTIANLLREHGLDPGPKRGEDSWDAFVKRHAHSLWACDFITKKIWTVGGLRDYFILFFINIGTRSVYVSEVTDHPNASWMSQQARNAAAHISEQPQRPLLLLRDSDTKFTADFDSILASEGIKAQRLTPGSPNLNAYAERFVQSIQQECLDHFVVFGEKHLRHIVNEYLDHYHFERPHQGIGNKRIVGDQTRKGNEEKRKIICRQRLGGLLKHYWRKAA